MRILVSVEFADAGGKGFQLWRQPRSQDLLNVESGIHLAANSGSPYRIGYPRGLVFCRRRSMNSSPLGVGRCIAVNCETRT
jgi:hypothetical protein